MNESQKNEKDGFHHYRMQTHSWLFLSSNLCIHHNRSISVNTILNSETTSTDSTTKKNLVQQFTICNKSG
jgi:hypothetical protein